MDSALLLQALARQRLIEALSLGISQQALAPGLFPVLAPPSLIPIAIAPVDGPLAAALSGSPSPAGASEWTSKEDALLKSLIAEHGTSKWSRIAAKMGSKTNRQCRRRWQAIVNAMGNKGSWTAEEDAKLLEGHSRFGNRWTDIARLVPGRTDNAVKNRFAALVAKGESVKSSTAATKWSELCSDPPSSHDNTECQSLSSPSSLKRKTSLGSDCLDSATFPSSLKRLRATVDLDLNSVPQTDVANAGWLSGASDQDCSEGSCVDDAADSPRSFTFGLDLNSPASL